MILCSRGDIRRTPLGKRYRLKTTTMPVAHKADGTRISRRLGDNAAP